MARRTRASIELRRSLTADDDTQRAILERMTGEQPADDLARVTAWLSRNPMALNSLARAIDDQEGGR